MSGENSPPEADDPIPEEVDVEALGACRSCNCEKFVEVNGSSKCGRSTCGHRYTRHDD